MMIKLPPIILETHIPNIPLFRRGKVRDVYDLDDALLIVATDRISAFDCVCPNGIPYKGEVLTQISKMWFETLGDVVPHHVISMDVADYPESVRSHAGILSGRSMFVKKTKCFPVECVVRGYLAGSGWKEYQKQGTVCEEPLAKGLRESDRIEHPIFTPATKAETGHDENISFAKMCDIVGKETAERLRMISLNLYSRARDYARERGIIIADTKFEFGQDKKGNIILIDEVLTPDSSRFWPADEYCPGQSQPNFDKQFVRDYLESLDWDKNPPAPKLPQDIVEKTSSRYLEAYHLLTGMSLLEKR